MSPHYPHSVVSAALVLLVLGCLGAPPAAGAPPYPAPGRPDPGVACGKKGAPPWRLFACTFMTVDRWRAAGRPDFTAADGSRWRPWYYGDLSDGDNGLLYEGAAYRARNEGLLEALQKTGTLPDEYDPAYVSRYWSLFRYTPWSVHFEREMGCGAGQTVNPPALAASAAHRAELLGLGWAAAVGDAADPTAAFAARGAPVMQALARMGPFAGPHEGRGRPGASVRRAIDIALRGGGERPDYGRDGEVWLVPGRGKGRRIDDLDRAAAEAARAGRLFVNAAGRTWRQGYDAAVARAGADGTLVYLYFAGDAFHPERTDRVFIRRLRYLGRLAARRAQGRIAVYGGGAHAALAGSLRGVGGLVPRGADRLRSPAAPADGAGGTALQRCVDVPGPPAVHRSRH